MLRVHCVSLYTDEKAYVSREFDWQGTELPLNGLQTIQFITKMYNTNVYI